MGSTIRFGWLGVAAVAAVVALGAAEASAQVLGTFQWRIEPFCNVLTLRVEQKGAIYELSGTDNLCGAAQAASANGSAHVNPNGTAGISLTVIRPDGVPIASSAAISLATLSGTWSDQYGNSGAFTFNPAGASGSPRPVTLRGSYSLIYTATAAGQDDASAFAFTYPLAAPPASPAANIIAFGGAQTANCPGSFANPQAAAGQLCIYERQRSNAAQVSVLNSVTTFNTADPTGATVWSRSTAAGLVIVTGKWAVTLP